MNEKLQTILKEKLDGKIIEFNELFGQLTVTIQPNSLVDITEFMKDDADLKYDFLEDLCGADYPKREARFEMIYHLYSRKNNHRVRLKATLIGKNPSIDSLTGLFAGANWPERETFDMYGIKFRNHPNMKRILLYEEFNGFPLRKDFPIEGRDRGNFPKGSVMNNKVVNAADLIKTK